MRLASALPVLLASGTIALSGCTTPKVLSPSSFSPSETYKQGFVIDEETLFFVKDDYQISDLGGQELKGFSEPVKVFTASEKAGT